MQIKSCEFHTTVSVKNPHVYTVVKLIEQDIRRNCGLKSLAKVVCVSPSYLSKLFRDEMGITLTEYVNLKRVLYGRHLLETTEDKVFQVASQCGMDDYNYFCRLFKRYIGVSPRQYRKLTIDEKQSNNKLIS